jgi:cytosine/adenosine deaminase-related metal-dependent hydrolase
VREYRAAGVNVGLGVDGSASNDGSHLLAEVRNAMLVARVKEGITGFSASPSPVRAERSDSEDEAGRGAGGEVRKLMSAREALYLGTRGGAAVLGRKDIGSLESGKCADFFAINLNRIGFTGMHDPVAALVFGQPVNADYTVVGGKFVVKEGQLVTVDEKKLIEKHNKAAKRLLEI